MEDEGEHARGGGGERPCLNGQTSNFGERPPDPRGAFDLCLVLDPVLSIWLRSCISLETDSIPHDSADSLHSKHTMHRRHLMVQPACGRRCKQCECHEQDLQGVAEQDTPYLHHSERRLPLARANTEVQRFFKDSEGVVAESRVRSTKSGPMFIPKTNSMRSRTSSTATIKLLVTTTPPRCTAPACPCL